MKRLKIYTVLAVVAMGACINTTIVRAEEDHIKMSKRIEPVGDSKTDYMITLETYVTGTQVNTVTTTNKPVDIVLTLDISSSMKQTVSGTAVTTYTELSSAGYTYNNIGSKYIKVGDNYYQVKTGSYREKSKNHYYLYYTIDGVNYYLSGNSVTTERPSTPTSAGVTIWTGVLYTATSTGNRRRIDLLDEAVKAFIDQIALNAAGPDGDPTTLDDNISNRICLIAWDKHEHYITGGSTNYTTSKTDSDYSDNFIDVLNADGSSNVEQLRNYVNSIVTMCNDNGSGTRQDRGILAARNCINAIPAARKEESNQVVVMFTDGEPYAFNEKINDADPKDQDITDATHPYTYSQYDGSTTEERRRVIYLAMDYGKPLKEAGVSMFSVAMGITSDTYKTWMDWISSNYPDAVREAPGTKITIPDGESGYFFDSKEGNNLTQIFEAIAQKTSTEGDIIELNSSSTAVVDIVSDNFLIPTGAELSEMKVWVESYYLDNNGIGQWAKQGDSHYYYAGPELTINLGSTEDAPFVDGSTTERIKNKLTVTNFNYGLEDIWNDDGTIHTKGNWVGKRGEEANPQYWGNKVVITFPVKVNKDYEGGYQMPSNDIKSGIYFPDPNDPTKMVQLRAYPVPSVDFPSLCIVKDGLKVGESAIFEVYKDDSTTPLYTFSLIQREISINDHRPAPCYMIIKRFDNGKYTVKEKTNWSWLYSTETETITNYVIAANQLGVTLADFEGNHSTNIYNNNNLIGLSLDPKDVNADNPSIPLCIIYDDSGEIHGNALSILFHFTNERVTSGKPARAESFSHNEFQGGKTQGGTETGGNEEEEI